MKMFIAITGLGLLFSICVAEGKETEKVTCTASAMHVGGAGHITCLFPEDLNQLQEYMDITVKLFSDTSETYVLECLRDSIHDCTKVEPGYKLSEFTGLALKITILKVTKKHYTGNFSCSVLKLNDSIHPEPCSLLINGSVPSLPPPPPPPRTVASDNQTSHQNNSSNSDPKGGMIAGIAVVVALLLLGVVVGIVIYKRRRQNGSGVSGREEIDMEECRQPVLPREEPRDAVHPVDRDQSSLRVPANTGPGGQGNPSSLRHNVMVDLKHTLADRNERQSAASDPEGPGEGGNVSFLHDNAQAVQAGSPADRNKRQPAEPDPEGPGEGGNASFLHGNAQAVQAGSSADSPSSYCHTATPERKGHQGETQDLETTGESSSVDTSLDAEGITNTRTDVTGPLLQPPEAKEGTETMKEKDTPEQTPLLSPSDQ